MGHRVSAVDDPESTAEEIRDLVAATLRELGKPIVTDILAESEARYLFRCAREGRSRIEVVSERVDWNGKVNYCGPYPGADDPTLVSIVKSP